MKTGRPPTVERIAALEREVKALNERLAALELRSTTAPIGAPQYKPLFERWTPNGRP